jgi:flagellar biosynthesis/type III secretory pathway chaperone
MNDDAVKTGNQLTNVLEEENAALRLFDFTAAAALVPRKETLIAALAGLVATMPLTHRPAALIAVGARLRELAAQNQQLLGQAIEIQTRIVRIVAQAGVQAETTYTPSGLRAQHARTAAMSLSARA